MLPIIVLSSLFVAFEFLSVIGKFSPKWLKRVLGYEWIFDIIMSFGLMIWFASTGSIMGIIISAVSGFLFSLILYAAKQIIGYQKLEKVDGKRVWVEYEGSWSWNGTGSLMNRIGVGIMNALKGLFAGFTEAKNAPKQIN